MSWAVPMSNVQVAFWYLCNSVLTLSQPVPIPSKPFHYLSLNVPTIVIKVPLPLSSHCLSFFCFCFCFLSSAIIFKKKKAVQDWQERLRTGGRRDVWNGVITLPMHFSPSSFSFPVMSIPCMIRRGYCCEPWFSRDWGRGQISPIIGWLVNDRIASVEMGLSLSLLSLCTFTLSSLFFSHYGMIS